ncbi:MAG: DNA-binding protein [Myxococcales bacterium]|nr:MAG: DNA-binding protein [Myxococcales bacterium]
MGKKKIGILGSGQVGQVLAGGFIKYGHDVMIGTRSPAKLEKWKAQFGGKGQIGSFQEAAKYGEIVVVACLGRVAEEVVRSVAGHLTGKTVIDTTNPIAETPPVNGVISFFTDLNGSLMERLQKAAPEARFVKAFNSVGNPFMVNPQFPGGKPTMFICGNDEGAKTETAKILDVFGWEPADMGGVESARAIEPLCILWCIPGLTRNQWTHAFKLLKL